MPDTDDTPRSVGVFGGSFDPVHEGHLRAAEEARSALALERVILVPAGSQPLKGARAGAEHRLAMVRLAVEGRPGLEASDVKVRRPGKSYTVDTVGELAEALAGELGPAVELHLLIGTDAARDLPEWRDVAGIFRRARPAILERPGERPVDWDELAGKLPEGLADRLRASAVRLERPVDVSSTEIRRRLASGESVAGLVPPAVEDYIRGHGLYGAADPDGRDRGGA